MVSIKCHFDGKAFVPDEPVHLPTNQPAVVYLGELEQQSHTGGVRPRGLNMGQFVVPDDFNNPLPEDVLKEFEGG